MSSNGKSKTIHDRLGHPVIDADGHYLEFGPSILDYLKRVAGDKVAETFVGRNERVAHVLNQTPEERREQRRAQEAFWAAPTKNTRDRATALLPRLLYERLDELGFDFTVLYPPPASVSRSFPTTNCGARPAAHSTCTWRIISANFPIG